MVNNKMSQKLGFPYMGLKINVLIFWIGILLSVLTFLTSGLYLLGYAIPVLLIGLLKFLGVFFTGWALLGFAVMKELTSKQRLTAFIFAIMLLTVLFFVVGYLPAKALIFSFIVA